MAPTATPVRRLRTHAGRDTGFIASLVSRLDFIRRIGRTFNGFRDVYQTLGYAESLGIAEYRERYYRGGVAERVVEAYPFATWAGGAKIIEDPDPENETEFERDIRILFSRLDVWSKLTRADILASLGHYSVLLIGAGGSPASPLPRPLKIEWIKPVAEDNAQVATYVEGERNRTDPRYGLPLTYKVTVPRGDAVVDTVDVHWSRIIHVAEGLLEDDLYGKPRLRAIWNYLDDLDKLIGGGSEAAWKRMDPGLQVDVDPEIEMDEEDEARLDAELDEYQHNLRRLIRTRGTTVNPLNSQVQSFGPNADAVIKLISATTGIPHRILTGSERGELASTQDRFNWSDRINERRRGFATPLIRQLITRLVDGGAITKPAGFDETATTSTQTSPSPYPGGYSIVWPEVGELSTVAKSEILNKLAAANQAMSVAGLDPVIFPDEARQMVLGLGPITDKQRKELADAKAAAVKAQADANAATVDPTGNEPSDAGAPAPTPSSGNSPGKSTPSAPTGGASAGT